MKRELIPIRTEALSKMMKQANERERNMLGEMHLFYEEEFAKVQAEHPNEMFNVAHSINLLVDDGVRQIMGTANGRKVKCTKGCSHCCHMHVSVTEAEAQLLIIAAAKEDTRIDWVRIEEQAKHDFAKWPTSMTKAQRRCTFLDPATGTCKVYDYRPSACRKYMVATDPKFCDPERYPGHKVGWVAAPQAEVVVSAMLGPMSAGSMPRMLLKAAESLRLAGEQIESSEPPSGPP